MAIMFDNVLEPLLRCELRKKTEAQPNVSFIEIRDVAIGWSTETNGSGQRVRVAAQEVVNEDGAPTTVVTKLQTIAEQQQQIIRTLSTPPTDSGRPRGSIGRGNCFQCRQPGHYARQCGERLHRSQPSRRPNDGCEFCGRRGHTQQECRTYASARTEARRAADNATYAVGRDEARQSSDNHFN